MCSFYTVKASCRTRRQKTARENKTPDMVPPETTRENQMPESTAKENGSHFW
jgi:hypothetical protein